MAKQHQFLNVANRDEAERRFASALRLQPLGEETVDLDHALGRVLAHDIVSRHDVPGFDRANYDGYAVRAMDTYGATEQEPRTLTIAATPIATGQVPTTTVATGQAAPIATGGMLPRGADAVVMVEDTDQHDTILAVRRAVTPGFGVAFAGTDIARGETVLWRGERLTSRETAVLAAIGRTSVSVWRQPQVAIISTGDELVPPGNDIRPGQVFDSNARILADAVREQGGVPDILGIVPDDMEQLRTTLGKALETHDVVLLSGGTSKGAGDLSYRAVAELATPGIIVHGVALKPGKPVCLAAHHGKPVAVLPGFPTSAIFTFHEFIAPVVRRLAGRDRQARSTQITARLAVPVRSQIGRTEYALVGVVNAENPNVPEAAAQHWAFPLGKGSGSITTFSRADGFITIPRHDEILDAGQVVAVQLIAPEIPLADLVVIGSHCVGLDYLLGLLQQRGWHTKFLAVGSTAGLQATQRGQCDLAGIHLLDPESGEYNRPFITEPLVLLPGYRRMQGVVYRKGDPRFEAKTARQAINEVKNDPDCLMVNRNQGSGTRLLIDRILEGSQPPGYAVQPRNHNAVAAAVAQQRADWGVAVEHVAQQAGLGFLPLAEEHYDFVTTRARLDKPALAAFRELLQTPETARQLSQLGCYTAGDRD